MRYPGSKARYVKTIVGIIQERRDSREVYIEPFIGGANSFVAIAPLFTVACASDGHEDIALMWDAVSKGWLPPETVSEELYAELKHAKPSPLRGFVGYGCSFGGKWFGGYARGGFNSDGTPRNHQSESYRAVLKKAPVIMGKSIQHKSFQEWTSIGADTVVYCDPPYFGTLEYKTTMDHVMFWKWAEDAVRNGALVIVSEQTAPKSWVSIHTFQRRSSTALADIRTLTAEHVFIHESQY